MAWVPRRGLKPTSLNFAPHRLWMALALILETLMPLMDLKVLMDLEVLMDTNLMVWSRFGSGMEFSLLLVRELTFRRFSFFLPFGRSRIPKLLIKLKSERQEGEKCIADPIRRDLLCCSLHTHPHPSLPPSSLLPPH